MTTTEVNIMTSTKYKTDWRDLLRSVLRDNPKDNEAVHKQNFKRLIQNEDYVEYLENLIDRMLSLEYNDIVRSVFPKSIEKLKAEGKAAKEARRTKERDLAEAIKEAKTKLASKAYGMVRSKTFGECALLGGWFTRISKAGKPNQIVGDVLTEIKFKELLK